MTITFDYLPATAFSLFLIFARVGPMVMMLPGVGEFTVPMRIRLAFAWMLTICIYPIVVSKIPALPTSLMGLVGMMLQETLIGFAFGGLIKLIASGLQVAGNVISFQSGLSFAQTADPMTGRTDSVFSTFMMMMGTTMILVLDLHHLIFAALYDSYMMFPVNGSLDVPLFSNAAIMLVASAFKIGVQLATPFIVFGLVFFLGLGVLSRLIPQIQVFFIAMPANIYIGVLLFALLIGAIMQWYLNYYEASLINFLK